MKHWDGSAWIADGASLNVYPDVGEAGRPSLAADGSRLILAWAEGLPGQKAQVYTRTLTGAGWGGHAGSLNVDPEQGAADTAVVAVSAAGVAFVAWAEKNVPNLWPKQVYVRGQDGAADSFTAPALTRFGANGPAPDVPPNTWVYMNAGGIAAPGAGIATGIGDEGFNTFAYSPHLRRAVTFGLYHARSIADGEDQNALLAYSFAENRWDVVEITEADGSEFLPGVGHDEGNATVDTVNGLYITHGNLTLHGDSAYRTFVYDLTTGRGARMMPAPAEPPRVVRHHRLRPGAPARAQLQRPRLRVPAWSERLDRGAGGAVETRKPCAHLRLPEPRLHPLRRRPVRRDVDVRSGDMALDEAEPAGIAAAAPIRQLRVRRNPRDRAPCGRWVRIASGHMGL